MTRERRFGPLCPCKMSRQPPRRSYTLERTCMTTRILIVDDHEIVREGLRSHLAKTRPDWKICGEGTDGQQAIELARELKPDVLILDITMPRMSGLQASSHM